MTFTRLFGGKDKTAASRGAAVAASDAEARPTAFEHSRNSLIDAIERGVISGKDTFGTALPMPYSATSGRMYHGQNIYALAAIAQERGYESGAWASYKTAQKQGWQVRKGERATRIFYYTHREEPTDKIDEVTGEPEMRVRPILTSTGVFNVAQMETADGQPISAPAGNLPPAKEPSPIAKSVLDSMADEMGNEISYQPDAPRSCYADGVVIVAAAPGARDAHAISQLALGLLDVGMQEGLRTRKPIKDPEVAEAFAHLRQVLAEAQLSMRLGFPIQGGTPVDADKVMLAVQANKVIGIHACGDAEAAVRYALSFDPYLADHLKAEGDAMHDEILDASGDDADKAFDASMIDFGYVEDRVRPGQRP